MFMLFVFVVLELNYVGRIVKKIKLVALKKTLFKLYSI